MSKTHTVTTVRPHNTSGEPVETWDGVEARYGDGGDNVANVPLSGFFSLSGDTQGVHIHSDSGLYTAETPYGDPGYLVHYTQDPGNQGFTLTMTVEYEPAV